MSPGDTHDNLVCSGEFAPPAGRKYTVTVCERGLPVSRGKHHGVTTILEEWGHRVTQTVDQRLNFDPDSVLWIQGNATWFPKIRRGLAALPRDRRPFVVLWFTEPLPPPQAARLPRPRLHLREYAKILLRDARATDVYTNASRLRSLDRHGLVDLLVASTPGRCEYLADHGINAHFVPLGFVSQTHGRDLQLERDIDVLFLGELVPRRKKLLARLEQCGVRVQRAGSWFDPAYWGEDRTRLLNRTRIFLNLARHPGELSGLRLILGMANKSLVVSEPIYSPGPYVPGRHFVSCTLARMPDVIQHYLSRVGERERITSEGYQLVTRTVTLKKSVARILDLIGEQLPLSSS